MSERKSKDIHDAKADRLRKWVENRIPGAGKFVDVQAVASESRRIAKKRLKRMSAPLPLFDALEKKA